MVGVKADSMDRTIRSVYLLGLLAWDSVSYASRHLGLGVQNAREALRLETIAWKINVLLSLFCSNATIDPVHTRCGFGRPGDLLRC